MYEWMVFVRLRKGLLIPNRNCVMVDLIASVVDIRIQEEYLTDSVAERKIR